MNNALTRHKNRTIALDARRDLNSSAVLPVVAATKVRRVRLL